MSTDKQPLSCVITHFFLLFFYVKSLKGDSDSGAPNWHIRFAGVCAGGGARDNFPGSGAGVHACAADRPFPPTTVAVGSH